MHKVNPTVNQGRIRETDETPVFPTKANVYIPQSSRLLLQTNENHHYTLSQRNRERSSERERKRSSEREREREREKDRVSRRAGESGDAHG